MPNARYEKVLEAFGGNGYFVKTPEEIQTAMKKSMANSKQASLVNVMISTTADRRAQVNMSSVMKKLSLGFPTRSGTNVTEKG